jgi:hypothetical protein
MPRSVPWAVVLCKFKDVPIPSEPESYYRDYLLVGLQKYFNGITYGAFDLTGSIVTRWYTMQYSWMQHWYHDGTLRRQAWFDEGVRLADADGFRFDPFYGILVVINAPADDSAVGTGAQPLRNVNYPKGFGQVVLNTSHGLGQTNWRYCKNCYTLFFGGNVTPGRCQAGGNHDSGDGRYLAIHDVAGFPGDAGWRWCSRCQELVHGPGICPAGGAHDMSTPSLNYIVGRNLNQQLNAQKNWWHCARCEALGYAAGGFESIGPCPAGGPHDYWSNNSPNYSVAWDTCNLNLNMGPHEFGHGFGLNHSRRLNDPVAGNDYGDTWDVMGAGQYYQSGGPYGSFTGPGLHAPNLLQLDCVPEEMISEYQVQPGGPNLKTVDLLALNAPLDWAGFRIARFYAGPMIYTVELRQPYEYDSAFPRTGVLIHQTTDRNYLVPSSSDGNNFDWQPGQVFDDPVNNFRVAVNAISAPAQRATVTVGVCGHEQGNWRLCDKCQGLAYNGNETNGACPAGGPHAFTGSADYMLTHDTKGAEGQPNWRFCQKCFGLVFAGNPPSPCPGGGKHDTSNSYNYILANNSSTFDGQDNWRWCSKCQGLAFAGNSTAGVCPADLGPHALTDSVDYVLVHDRVRPYGQRSWRYCRKCQGLVYSESKLPGACPNGSVHDFSQSADYWLVHDLAGALGQDNWRYCRKCQGLAYGGNTPAGVCPTDHQPHDLSTSYDYILAHDNTNGPGQDNWRWCSNCQGLVYNGAVAGKCPAGGTHKLDPTLASYRLVNGL